jgi:DNA-binding MarR family transcriptional regulator
MTDRDTPVDTPLLLACRELGRAMDAFDESACAVLKLGRSDLRALNLLEHGPLTAGTLADRLGLTRPAVTALVDRLVDAGYVRRVSVPGDRRAAAVEIRPATWRAFAKVYRPLGERVSTAAGGLSGARQRALTAAMLVIAAAFDEARAANVTALP